MDRRLLLAGRVRAPPTASDEARDDERAVQVRARRLVRVLRRAWLDGEGDALPRRRRRASWTAGAAAGDREARDAGAGALHVGGTARGETELRGVCAARPVGFVRHLADAQRFQMVGGASLSPPFFPLLLTKQAK